MGLTARLLGRELNSASPEPSLAPAPRGLRVTVDRGAAGSTPFAGPHTLVSARVFASAVEATEALLELRADAAGAPGAPLGGPAVSQVRPDFRGWLEFDLPKPVPLESQTLWLTIRVNKGGLFWFQGVAGQQVKVTADRGQTWAAPAEGLTASEGLLVQLFHASTEPFAPPVVRLERQGTTLAANLMSAPEQKGGSEFVKTTAELPGSLSNILAGTQGQGRVPVGLDVYSAQVLDLSIDDLTLYYDPFEAAGAA
jgi:hypothetical protein